MDESFQTAPVDEWCNTSVGYSVITYGSDGATLQIPPTVQSIFPYNNAEILPRPRFLPGMTMVYDIQGAEDITDWNGTTGWGISNRSIDPLALEVAWFIWNGSASLVGTASEITAPLFHVLGQDFPQGFFMMVKKAGTLLPQVVHLDPALLHEDHEYAVRLWHHYVDFYIDGERVGRFTNPPVGTYTDLSLNEVPMMGQIWLDSSYWFPLPLPEYNGRWQTLTVSRYRQGFDCDGRDDELDREIAERPDTGVSLDCEPTGDTTEPAADGGSTEPSADSDAGMPSEPEANDAASNASAPLQTGTSGCSAMGAAAPGQLGSWLLAFGIVMSLAQRRRGR